MAESSWPFSGQSNSEGDWSKLIGTLADTGVVSGLDLTAGSGMQVLAAAGAAVIQGFYYNNSASKPLTIGAAHATLTRRDYVILKLDLSADSITMSVKAGTASGSTGTLPALTQNASVWEHPIGVITIPGGASNIVSGNIAQLLVGTGLRVIPYADESQRPTPITLRALGVNLATRRLELWVVNAWYSITPDVDWSIITGKPATFAPSAHSHAQSDITGLVAALAGKSDTSHTHAYSSLTGIPSTFTPAAHNQTVSTITDLSTNGDVAKLKGKTWTIQTAATADPMSGNTVGDLLIEY